MDHPIRFYSVGDEYGEFSNFAPFPIVIDGKRWPTSEHFFQSQKFLAPKDQEDVRRAKTPAIAARMGRDRKRKLRNDWESRKVNVMARALRAKFSQHSELAELLLSTGEAKLIEHTDADAFWGNGGDDSGKNMLGRLLMDLRSQLRAEKR